MNVKDQMALDYSDLSEGESRAGQLCPSCKGGTSGEATLSVSRRGGSLLWICHRASCSFRGSTAGGRSYLHAATKTPSTRGIWGRQYIREASSLPDEVATLLSDRYQIDATLVAKHKLGWTDGEEGRRLVIPVRDYYGEERGAVLRSFDGSFPKAKSHTEHGAIAWFTNPATTSCVIVEDCLSAIRASVYSNSVALLGTNFNDDMAQEIREAGMSPVYMALDADAYNKAVKYVIKYRSTLNMRLLILAKDLKDCTEEELKGVMHGVTAPSS